MSSLATSAESNPSAPTAPPQFYKMAIVFALDISDPILNQMTMPLDGSRVVMQNAMEVTLTQTVPFVPTEEILDSYANAIRDNLNEAGKIHVENIRFARYDFLKPVDAVKEEPKI